MHGMGLKAVFAVLVLSAAGLASSQSPSAKFWKVDDSRAGRWKASTTYVRIEKKTPVIDLANKLLFELIDSERRRWLQEALPIGRSRQKPSAPYELEIKPVLSLVRDNLVSGYIQQFSYTGGAHPNTVYQTIAVGLVNGKPKALRFKDLLLSGTNPTSVLLQLALPKINAAKRSSGYDPIDSLDAKLADSFVVTPSGLTWVIAPYQAGAYSEGAFFPKATFSECEGLLDPAGPLRSLLPNQWVGESVAFPCEAFFLEKILLPEGATLEALVFDVEQGEGSAISTYRESVRFPPFPFTVHGGLRDMKPGRSYALTVKIVVDGEAWFKTPQPIPVTREGWKQTKRIRLVRARG